MNRREFLKISAVSALVVAGSVAGVRSFSSKDSKEKTFRSLGNLKVSSIGLGCLPMVGYYGGYYEKDKMVSLIRRAFDKGVTFFDTAEVYGPYTSEEWVGEALAPVR